VDVNENLKSELDFISSSRENAHKNVTIESKSLVECIDQEKYLGEDLIFELKEVWENYRDTIEREKEIEENLLMKNEELT
jgi:hypothetical protein